MYSCSAQLSHFTNLLQRDASKTSSELNYVSTLTYVAYLWNSECRRTANATKAKYWPKTIPSSERTYKWMFAYSIVTSSWIPASVGLIVSAFYCRSKNIMVNMAVPWLLVTFTLTVMDLSAAIIYIGDIFQMTTKSDYLHFIGINPNDVSSIVGKTPNGWKHHTIIPGIIFAMIYLRLVVVWLINIYLLVKVFQEVRRLRREKKKERKHISQNFEMSIINTNIHNIQERRPSSRTPDLPKEPTYVPWTDVVTFKTNPFQSLKNRKNPDLHLNTKIAEEYNQAQLRKLNEEFQRKYFPSDSHLVSIAGETGSPNRMRRRHSEEAHTWQEKVKDLNMRRFSEQQHQIKVIAELLEQKKRDQQGKMVKQVKSKDPAGWYEPIWEMETADTDSHYTTIESDMYNHSPVFDYLGQPARRLKGFKWSLDSSSYQRYKRQIILNYPITSPTLRDNNPLRRIWNEIQQLKYGSTKQAVAQAKPPPSPKIDYEL